jgi:carboxyl-terminal processing protease
MENEGVIKRLRGKKGTQVKIAISRRSQQGLIEFKITRDKIPVYSIEASYMVNENTGYVKLLRFSATTMNEFRQAMEKLKGLGMQNLIMDLQGNSGGYLTTAVQLSNEFIPKEKQLIVYTEGLRSRREEYFSEGKGALKEGKLIILVDEGSASASEIFAGCMQDIDRGLVIGRRTFGKGLVQKPFYFPDASMVRLTVAHYYTPSGRCIQKEYKSDIDLYDREMEDRFMNGELFSRDSIKFDNQKFYETGLGRMVQAGGGIVPDIFVPLDTLLSNSFLIKLMQQNLLREYALIYYRKNKSFLKKSHIVYSYFPFLVIKLIMRP